MSSVVRRVTITLSILTVGVVSPAAAQNSSLTVTSSARPARTFTVSAVRSSTSLLLDGRLDDAAWSNTSAAGEFTQQSPEFGRPASQRTETRVLVDGDAVYVAMRLFDSAPDSIVATLARRDYTGYSDWAHVIIDSFHDRRTAFRFAVNPAGVKRDGFISGDQEWSEDYGWDAVWDVATRRDSVGWTAEFKIPLSQLRFAGRNAADGGAVWGIEFARDVARRGERSYWAPIPPDAGTYVSNFGTLTGVPVHEAKRRLEIAPYAVARTRRSREDLTNPFNSAITNRRIRRRRLQDRAHVGYHRHRHREPRLRAGRGRPVAGEPVRRRAALL